MLAKFLSVRRQDGDLSLMLSETGMGHLCSRGGANLWANKGRGRLLVKLDRRETAVLMRPNCC